MIWLKHWIPAGALLLAAAGFVSLGRWQLDRAEVNRQIADRFLEAAERPMLERPVAEADADDSRYRRIRLGGRYEDEVQILLDNMMIDGRVGYQVLTPFRVEDSEALVLVNRGWVPADPDRRRLPDIALNGEVSAVTGRVDHLPRAGLRLDAPPGADDRPVVVLSFPDYADIEAVLGRRLLRFQVLLDPEAEAGFVREWQPPENRDRRNIGYAVQWFALAGLALILAAGAAARRYRNRPESAA